MTTNWKNLKLNPPVERAVNLAIKRPSGVLPGYYVYFTAIYSPVTKKLFVREKILGEDPRDGDLYIVLDEIH